MAENPLLPHSRLKELYALMKRIHTSLQTGPRVGRGLEAVLASTLIQLEQGDVFCALDSTSAKASFLSGSNPSSSSVASEIFAMAVHNRALPDLSSLIALGMRSAGRKSAAISLTSATVGTQWAEVLHTAQEKRAPLVPLLVDTTPPNIEQAFSWAALSKIAKKLSVPTVSVDGQDAVAIYRVVQECLHRARQGDGPAVIWCTFVSENRKPKASPSIVSMERYLAVRGLFKPAGKATQTRA